MSYILDALKKADADREREAAAVPDLYAQADAMRGARAGARAPTWLLPAGAGGIVALAALAWWWLHSAPDEPPRPTAVASTPSAAPAAPAPNVTSAAPSVAAPVVVPTAAPTAAPIPPPASLPPPAPAPAFLAPPVARPASARAPAPAVVAAEDRAPARAAASAIETRLPSLAELPPDIRSQLPPLSVSGSMYSPNAANRMVILNGQVLREGDKPIDGLTVEHIRLKSAVLVFRGVRFELRY